MSVSVLAVPSTYSKVSVVLSLRAEAVKIFSRQAWSRSFLACIRLAMPPVALGQAMEVPWRMVPSSPGSTRLRP